MALLVLSDVSEFLISRLQVIMCQLFVNPSQYILVATDRIEPWTFRIVDYLPWNNISLLKP
jgi:hypothetical protein